MVSIFPRQEDFFVLFRRQGAIVRQGCEQLLDMMERFEDLEAKAARLKNTEHEGDVVTHEIFEKLNRTFVTPLEREDIHGLASGLDDLLDAVEAIGSRLVLFKVPETTPESRALAHILVQCGTQVEQAVNNLKNLKHLSSFTIELNRLENEADAISRTVVADLFNGRHDPIDVLRWKELYGRLEAAADIAEDIANIIDGIVLKNR
jgi:predicted phosphate transport protein (TIGR00153 family)